jgi:hypothetical protein
MLDGHATATPEIIYAGGRPITVTWLTITDRRQASPARSRRGGGLGMRRQSRVDPVAYVRSIRPRTARNTALQQVFQS